MKKEITKKEINNLKFDELENEITHLGYEKYRSKQIFEFIHKQKVDTFEAMNNIPKDIKEQLNIYFTFNTIKIYDDYKSKKDGTVKFLFQLDDKNIIESVVMKYKYGYTQCISTQVGCKMGCKFCASTKDGFIRNLSAAEMLEQVYRAENYLNMKVKNIVLMGSGEPLDNYENVINFLHLINDQRGHNTSLRNITLSTCGIVEKINELADENLPVTLSLSLHSPFDSRRQLIMPISKKYKLDDIIDSIRRYYFKTKRRVTFEYTLIKGFNDRIEDVEMLKEYTKGIDVHINIIPINPIKEYKTNIPSNEDVINFSKMLKNKGIKSTIRREMGSDISASCGQLKRSIALNK